MAVQGSLTTTLAMEDISQGINSKKLESQQQKGNEGIIIAGNRAKGQHIRSSPWQKKYELKKKKKKSRSQHIVKMARRNDPYMPFRQQNAHLTLSICGGRHIWSLKSHEHGLLSPRTASARYNCAATAPRAAGSQHPPWGTHRTETDELFCSKFLS